MYAGVLYVFGDCIGYDFAAVGYGVHLDFFGSLDKAADDDGVFGTDVGGETEEAFEFFLIGADVHGCA